MGHLVRMKLLHPVHLVYDQLMGDGLVFVGTVIDVRPYANLI